MADVDKLLSEYITEHLAGGEADPLAYLERADQGIDRGELAELIDAYLARSPGREWDPEAFKGSEAEKVADGITRSLQGASGWWPMVLPRLRDKARLTRGQVVEKLSAALGAPGREQKVGGYYHAMEHGSLDSRGVSQRVIEALAGIYGADTEFLRELGERRGEGSAAAAPSAPAMARTAYPDPAYADARLEDPDALGGMSSPAEAERDEVDELFTGGA